MWYALRLILKCTVGNQISDFLCDEQVRLIEASNAEEAYTKALQLGQEEECEYLNSEQQKVKWTFEGLFDLDCIDSLEDGVEITSKRFIAQSSDNLIVSKDQLSIFFKDNNKDETAQQILNNSRTGADIQQT